MQSWIITITFSRNHNRLLHNFAAIVIIFVNIRNLIRWDSKCHKFATLHCPNYLCRSEVIIAHQEHISEILRISIEEEKLYHNLRERWDKGTSFETYTRSLVKLLSRKTRSIEALKVGTYWLIYRQWEDSAWFDFNVLARKGAMLRLFLRNCSS